MNNSSIITQPQHPGIGSLVPMDEPAIDLKQEKQTQAEKFSIDKGLTKFILGKLDKFQTRQRSEWLDIKKQMVRSRQYFDGRQYGDVNNNFQWIDDRPADNETIYTENFYQTHVQTALMELVRPNPQLTFSFVAPNDRMGEKITKLAEERYKYYRKRLFTASVKQHEKLSALLNGVSARYTFFEYDSPDEQQGRNTPVFTSEPMDDTSAEQIDVCANCYAPKKGDKCESCGDTEFKTLGGGEDSPKTIQMTEEKAKGRSRFVNVDPLGLTFDLKAQTIEESPYLIWEQLVLEEVLEAKYPDTPLQDGVTSPELLYDTEQDTPGDNLSTVNANDGNGTLQFKMVWFDYDVYCKYTPKSDIKLRNGKVIKAGTALGKAFPKGMFAAVNGERILDLWGEDKNRKWTIAPYVTRIGTLVGAGMTVLLSQQDRKNDIVNLIMASNYRDTFRQEYINSRYLTNDDIPADPTERAEIEVPDGVKIVGNIIDVLPPSQLAPQIKETELQIEASSQAQVGTFSTTGGAGMADMKGATDTLGGVQLMREFTAGRFAPMLEMQADLLDREQAYQLLLNDQEFLGPDDWQKIKGDYGAETVQAFMECDIRNDIIIEVVRESYMPKTASQRQSNLSGYLQVMAMMANAGMANPEQVAQVAELFDQPQIMSDFAPTYDVAMSAVGVWKEITEAIVMLNGDIPSINLEDPMTRQLIEMVYVESGIEIDDEMDNHAVMIEGYHDWWVTDEGKEASNLLKAVVAGRVALHQLGAVRKAQKEMVRAMAAQQPMMDAQAKEKQAMQEQDAEAQTAEQEGAMVEGLAQFAESDAEREHQLMLKEAELDDADRQREHEAAMAAREQPERSGGVLTVT